MNHVGPVDEPRQSILGSESFSPLCRIKTDENTRQLIEQLFQSESFRDNFNASIEKHQLKRLHVKPLSSAQAKFQHIPKAAMLFTMNTTKCCYAGIHYHNHRDVDDVMRNLVMEFCNAYFIKEHHDLNVKAKSHSIDKETYVKSKEKLEWQAFKKANTILDELRIPYPSNVDLMLEDFEEFYHVQRQSKHTEYYKHLWDQISTPFDFSATL